MKLTIGMATYDDYDGVYFTIQALRTYHVEVMQNVEIIVVDNNPNGRASPCIQNLLKCWGTGLAGARYIPMSEPKGTTQPRNRIFEEATGDAVLCLDSHVLLHPGSLYRLFQHYHDNPLTNDLFSGPLLYDDMTLCGDHFVDYWRAEMWGIWGAAWSCPCGVTRFTVINANNRCEYYRLAMGLEPATDCPNCHKPLPELPYPHHQQHLTFQGFNQLAYQDKPYEIPGMGLGLFTCRREAWLGFNPHFRGFGGEEMYIHEKYRQASRRCICLPWLKWGHRFGRPNGTPYLSVCTRHNKVRNYIIGLQELGQPLDQLYEHFITGKLYPKWAWNLLIEDAIGQEALRVPQGFLPPKEELAPAAPIQSNTMREALNAG